MLEINLGTAAVIFLCAFVFELIDSSLGQGYGTLGSPTYILLGYNPKLVVPAILLSQTVGGLVGSYMQNYWGNVAFWGKNKSKEQLISPDLKQTLIIVGAGVGAAAIAAWFGVQKLSGDQIRIYLGLIVLAIGIIILSGRAFKFSWKKMIGVGIYSAINKALTGGGYGPITCGGQVVCGTEGKRAVGITNLAEPPICITAFVIWMIFSYNPEFIPMVAPMAVGAGAAGMIGPWFTYKTPPAWFKYVLGVVFVLLGIAVLMLKVIKP